jgi:hypothetical protein
LSFINFKALVADITTPPNQLAKKFPAAIIDNSASKIFRFLFPPKAGIMPWVLPQATANISEC